MEKKELRATREIKDLLDLRGFREYKVLMAQQEPQDLLDQLALKVQLELTELGYL